MPLRVAVIGTGFGATTQIPGFRRLEDVQVVAVASARLSRARETAQRFGIAAAFDDYRAMLDQVDVDLVSVVSPPSLHREMVLAALERGTHVICEKPFAMNLAQAREMLHAAERAGVVHAVDHEFRYLAARSAFKRLVDQGFLGEPRLVRVVMRSDLRTNPRAEPFGWWYRRDQGGGVLGANGSHYLDALRWWFGEIRDVVAALDAFVPRRPLPDGSGWGEVTADDSASLLLHVGESRAQVTLSLTQVSNGYGSRVEAYGTDGTLVIEDDERVLGGRAGERLEPLCLEPERFPRRAGEPRLVGPFAELAARVLARIRGERGPDFPTFREGAAVQAAMDAAYRSVREGMRVAPEAV